MSFISLPPELQIIIASELHVCDLLHLLSTTHYLYALLSPVWLKAAVKPKGEPPLPALLWAAQRGHEPLVRLLLADNIPERYKTDVNITGSSEDKNQTALHIASQLGYESIVRILLEKGADVDARNSQNLTPLFCAVQYKTTTPGTIRLLLENATDFSTCNTILHAAASYGRADVIRVLVEELGIDVNIRNGRGDTPLLASLDPDHKDRAEREAAAITLLELGADPRLRAYTPLPHRVNTSPLFRAHSRSAENLITIILQKLLPLSSPFFDYPVKDRGEYWFKYQNDGKIALLWAAHLNDTNMVRYLLSAGVQITPNKGGNIWFSNNDFFMSTTPDFNSETALHRASDRGYTDVINLLLDASQDIIDAPDDTGWTPLHFAARGVHYNAVKTLLERGANVNAKNDCEITALHWAVQNVGDDAVNLVELLLENGADVGATGGEDTVLEWALNYGGDERIVERLLYQIAEQGGKLERWNGILEAEDYRGWDNELIFSGYRCPWLVGGGVILRIFY